RDYLLTGLLNNNPPPGGPVLPPGVKPGVLGAAERAYSLAKTRVGARYGKWGTSYLEEDRNLHISALGFSTLVRRAPAETVVFNLCPTPATSPSDTATVTTVRGSPGGPGL